MTTKALTQPFAFSHSYTLPRHELDEGEYVLSMEAVTLENKQTTTGVKLYIAVGTAYYRGEDLSTRGRVSLTLVIYTIPPPKLLLYLDSTI